MGEVRPGFDRQCMESVHAVGLGERGVQRDGLLEFLYCLSQKTRFPIGAPKDYPQLGPITELAEHALENLLCQSELMLLEVSQA